jgi:hypothetical protein
MSKVHNEGKWAEARKRCRLSEDEVRAAREMGLNPLSLIKNIPNASQRWKAPVGEWIRAMYEKRYGRPLAGPAVSPRLPGDGVREPDPPDGEPDFFEDIFGADDGPPGSREIAEENARMVRRQREFRRAAEYVTTAFAGVPEMERVVLIGSAAVPLKKEVPRFKRFRRAGVAIWHECNDVDLAVWVSSLDRLKDLQRARGRALNDLFAEAEIGVAHHQVDIFLMEDGSDRYLGRLCGCGVCPKGKRECETPGCGSALFLQQLADFKWRPSALVPAGAVTLFDRAARIDADEDCPF